MKSEDNKKRYIIEILMIVIALGAIVWARTYIPEAEIHDGKIQRSYEEILKYLEEAPEKITAQPYQAHLSKIVQKDIQTMLNSDEEIIIYYENADKSSQIVIRRDDNDAEKIQIAIFGISEDMDLFAWDDAIVDEISFYKKGEHIVIYGTGKFYHRELITRDISLTGYALTHYDDLDLCGTEYFENYDNIWKGSQEMTLIRKGNEFKFFKSGVQQGLTTVFDGKILEMNDDIQCILDDKQNLWYMAYSSAPENPWIHFTKVDENVSEVLDRYDSNVRVVVNKEDNGFKIFPVYIKNGKRYAAVKDSTTFGQGNTLPLEELNFDLEFIELSEKNIKKVEFEYREFSEEWWIKLIYKEEPYLVYEYDVLLEISYLPYASEEEINRFNGITVTWSEFDEILDELKQIYERK